MSEYIVDQIPNYGLRCRLGHALTRWFVKPRLNPRYSIDSQRQYIERINSLRLIPKEITIKDELVEGLPCERHINARDERGLLLFFHGGAFVLGSPATHRELVARLAAAGGMDALVPDYRLAPEHAYPAALDDCLGVYRALIRGGRAARDIVIAGDSAGGCLAALVCQRLRDAGEPLPGAMFLISPLTDLTGSGESIVSKADIDPMVSMDWAQQALPTWSGDVAAESPEVSPLFGQQDGLPPTLIQVGTEEMLLADAERFAQALHEAQVPVRLERWHRMWHDFQLLAALMPPAQEAIDRAGIFMRSMLDAPEA